MLPRFVHLTLTFACVSGLPAGAGGQARSPARAGVFGGPSLTGAEGIDVVGVYIAATAGRAPQPGVGLRFDVGYTGHGTPTILYNAPCPPSTSCGPVGPATARGLKLFTATANAVYVDRRAPRGGGYWTAGLGLYAVTQSLDGSCMRPGWNLGVGWPLGKAGFLELRYHALIKPQGVRAFLPIAFGIRF